MSGEISNDRMWLPKPLLQKAVPLEQNKILIHNTHWNLEWPPTLSPIGIS